MTNDEFLSFARGAGLRAVKTYGRMGCLIYSQEESGQLKVREPELRIAFGLEAQDEEILYGIEVPTHFKYRFTKEPGTDRRSGCMDFVVFDAPSPEVSHRDVLVEFKEGQPSWSKDKEGEDCAAIKKDLHKRLVEPALSGKSMFHVRHAADRDTVPRILAKYEVALRRAAHDTLQQHQAGVGPEWFQEECWFEFLLLVEQRRGKVGGNRPHLYRLSFPTLGHAARAALAGSPVFQADALLPVAL
jgi:hypothetical protein